MTEPNISRMIQLSVGVVDAVPVDARPAMAELRIAQLAAERHGSTAHELADDELRPVLAEIISQVETLYNEGRFNRLLCGLPVSSSSNPVSMMLRLASQRFTSVGVPNYEAIAKTSVEALVEWAQAHPTFDNL
jgi:hypothetical protein